MIISTFLCTLSDHDVLPDTDSQTQRNKWRHAHTPPPIHLSILGMQFSPLVLLHFSKWMIKSTAIQVSRNVWLLPAAAPTARRKQSYSQREDQASSTFIKINIYLHKSQLNGAGKHFETRGRDPCQQVNKKFQKTSKISVLIMRREYSTQDMLRFFMVYRSSVINWGRF